MRLPDISLRYWAFRQFLRDRRNDPRGGEDGADFARSRREFFFRSVIRGHLVDRCFVGMGPDFPQLALEAVINDDAAVLAVAVAHLEHNLEIGEVRSGYLAGYIEAQRRHLASCPRCRASVIGFVREDVATSSKIRNLFGSLGPDAKRRIVEEFVPARIRRRNDPNLN
ncbi:MAG TPA: hypothetical protein VL500_07695 [Candidatus Eisenbacteria bacterium]|jgi:hypothetical protein|nr:hypothetical protein [Candidatus Eisenbacteria bacterium]